MIRQIFIAGAMLLGALVVIMFISQVLDAVMSAKVQKVEERHVPASK